MLIIILNVTTPGENAGKEGDSSEGVGAGFTNNLLRRGNRYKMKS
jgi:hypothetical protein